MVIPVRDLLSSRFRPSSPLLRYYQALELSASPSVKATGTVEAHLIPSLNLGISVFGNTLKTNVFLNLDASATLVLTLEAQAHASTTLSNGRAYYDRDDLNPAHAAAEVASSRVNPLKRSSTSITKATSVPQAISSAKSASLAESSPSTTTRESALKSESRFASTARVKRVHRSKAHRSFANSFAKSVVERSPTPKGSAKLSAETRHIDILAADSATNTSFGGCFEIKAGLSVNAGADAEFFGLFDRNTKTTLFLRNFELLKVRHVQGSSSPS